MTAAGRRLAAVLITAVMVASVPLAADSATVISGEVTTSGGRALNGIVLLEKGRLYGKDFRYGGLLTNGRFSIPVGGPGSYGLHIYATGYIYFPLALEAAADRDNHGRYSLPPNPAAAHAPIISDVRLEGAGEQPVIALTVNDPDGDLSHQVLAFNRRTGEARRMSPPSFVYPFARKYPNGRYTIRPESGTVSLEDWYFVAADNKCYNSPVLGHPFDSTGAVAAFSNGDAKTPATAAPAASGREVFDGNCSMCHYRDSEKTKVGPGLKGLYGRELTPVLKNPVTDENIRRQVLQGGRGMPPYSHLSQEQVKAVVEYLKKL